MSAKMRSTGRVDRHAPHRVNYPPVTPSLAIDWRNVILGVAVEYRDATGGERDRLHYTYKYIARREFGWIDSSGSAGATVESVYQDLCSRLAVFFGLTD